MDLEEYKKIALARLNKSIAFDQKKICIMRVWD